MPENETGKRLKCLRYDNGGEYCNKEFDSYYSYYGILREKTVLGTPQENVVSERMSKTIMEHARCMRLDAGLPLQFWDDVVYSVVYLINRGPSSTLDGGILKEAWTCKNVINKGPSSTLDGGILEEAWTCKKVNYSFLRTFDCEAFVHIDKKIEQSLRLNPRNVLLLNTE